MVKKFVYRIEMDFVVEAEDKDDAYQKAWDEINDISIKEVIDDCGVIEEWKE